MQSGAGPIVLLNVVPETADKKGRAEHEERVGNDGAGDRAFHQRVLPGMERRSGDHQLGQVSQGRIEQTPTASPVFSATDSVA